jgi:hypothetical protein
MIREDLGAAEKINRSITGQDLQPSKMSGSVAHPTPRRPGSRPPSPKADYDARIDARLRALDKGSTLDEAVAACGGAFPSVVASRLEALGVSTPQAPANSDGSRDEPVPELHPLDFEWYFTAESCELLSELLASAGSPVFLGTPTVAAAMGRGAAAMGRGVVIDRNLLAFSRQPMPVKSSCMLRHDLRWTLPRRLYRTSDAVVFDAPWYEEDVTHWLWQAHFALGRGGRLAFALYPELTRARASAERGRILARAEALGRVQLHPGALRYRTPRFEREALAAAGVGPVSQWRTGDLVLVEVRRTELLPRPVVSLIEQRWETFVIGRQVVKLRLKTCGTETLDSILADGTFTFPTVRRTDERRKLIDLWTSRNTVAQVGQRPLVSRWLKLLSATGNPQDVLHDAARLAPAERAAAHRFLTVLSLA